MVAGPGQGGGMGKLFPPAQPVCSRASPPRTYPKVATLPLPRVVAVPVVELVGVLVDRVPVADNPGPFGYAGGVDSEPNKPCVSPSGPAVK